MPFDWEEFKKSLEGLPAPEWTTAEDFGRLSIEAHIREHGGTVTRDDTYWITEESHRELSAILESHNHRRRERVELATRPQRPYYEVRVIKHEREVLP